MADSDFVDQVVTLANAAGYSFVILRRVLRHERLEPIQLRRPAGGPTPRPINGQDANGNVHLVCTPNVNADGSLSTAVSTAAPFSLSCGDDHWAWAIASCSGTGVPGDLALNAPPRICSMLYGVQPR